MNQHFLSFVAAGLIGAVVLTFCGVNLFLCAFILSLVIIVCAACLALAGGLIDTLQNFFKKEISPAVKFFINCAVLYLAACELMVASMYFLPQFSHVFATICLSGAAGLTLIGVSIWGLRTILIKYASR